jgi:glycosyltransferase involved in cell wall biosynthesis
VDRHVPARVAYLTGTWDPRREAISKEIATLRAMGRPPGRVVAFSPANASRWAGDGVLTLSNRRWLLLRAAVAAFARSADVTHVFGPMDAWHLLRAAGARPTVFTVVAQGPALDAGLYDRVSVFAAESEQIACDLAAAGVDPGRVRTVYPGVDLQAFVPAPFPPIRPFRLLFASSPSDAAELEARGVPLLVELARRLTDVEVLMLWRPWGSARAADRALAALDPPPNVLVEHGDVRDMASAYARAHAVVACFAPGAGKACPNSIVEGLACGRAALVSRECGIAPVIERTGAGRAVSRTVDELAAAVDDLRREVRAVGAACRAAAQQYFDVNLFRRQYLSIYAELAGAAEHRSGAA